MRLRLLPHWVPCSEHLGGPTGHAKGRPHPDDGHAQLSTRPGLLLSFAGIALFAAGLLSPWWGRWLPDGRAPGPAAGWLVTLVGMVWMVWTFGWWWRRTWRGVVVTGRNVASLSLLQALAWTVLLLSLVLVVAAWSAPGLGGKALDAAGLARPDEPLAEVGVQVGTVAVTSAAAVGITAGKKRRTPTGGALDSMAKADVARRPDHHAKRLVGALGVGTEPAVPQRRQAPAVAAAAAAKGGKAAQGAAGPSAAETARERRAMDQAQLVLGRLRATPDGGGAAVPLAQEAARPADVVEAAALVLGATEMEAWTASLLRGQVPGGWEDIRQRLEGRLGRALPPIDQVREAVKRAAQMAARADVARARTGSVFRNACACQARFTDVLEGDEVADHESKDGSKVQFLVVTLGALLAMVLWAWDQVDVGSFGDVFLPGLPEGMELLTGATAAGYLGGKLPQRTPVEGVLP